MAENATGPTEEEIAKLPRGARVAFAARCARRVLPLFGILRPTVVPAHVHAVEAAVRAAEATPVAAGAFMIGRAASDVADNEFDAARDVAYSAVHAALAAHYASTGADSDLLRVAYQAVRNAARSAPKTIPAIRSDFNTLHDRAAAENWAHDTPVPPDIFGPMWPKGLTPDWAKEPPPAAGAS